MFDINAVKNNMYEDLKRAKNNELKEIYLCIKRLLIKYDADGIYKNIKDNINIFLTPLLRDKCCKRFIDLIEEYDKITNLVTKREFEHDIIALINIHKCIFEKIGELFKGL